MKKYTLFETGLYTVEEELAFQKRSALENGQTIIYADETTFITSSGEKWSLGSCVESVELIERESYETVWQAIAILEKSFKKFSIKIESKTWREVPPCVITMDRLTDLREKLAKFDDVKIEVEDNELKLYGYHHDGVVTYTVRALNDAYPYYSKARKIGKTVLKELLH